VALGPDGAVAGLGAGAGYVDMSTVDAATSRAIGAAVTAAQGRFLEAPVSGSKGPAEQGTLVILAAGDRSLYEEAAPALDALGRTRLFLGGTGQAARLKLVVNMIMGGMMAAFSEGLALAQRAGLAPDDLLAALAAGALANPMFAAKGPLMAAGRDEPAFALKHARKDLRLARELGRELGLRLDTAAAADALLLAALAAGLGERDFSAVHRVVAGRDGA
ncbi:MAG: NAD(P)-dependent oxidoreductase, partial [Krumholzibacteria bacterium]|nr:NAD(P)-dependent oxidoreductase [Candidatus Krumholzibacteria bacterium]